MPLIFGAVDSANPEQPSPGQAEALIAEPYDQFSPVFSPDGKWIAYTGSEANFSVDIYVRSADKSVSAPKWRVSPNHGLYPVWSRRGNELFYSEPDGRLVHVKWTSDGATFIAGKPEPWSPAHITGPVGQFWMFDLAPDGTEIVALPAQPAERPKRSVQVTVLLNFFDELKRRM